MSNTPAMQKLQHAIEGAMDEMQRKGLVPMQKEAFLCSARCCDQTQDMQQLQQCTVNCQQKIQAAHQMLYGSLEDFQRRFQRCLMRCDDQARDALPSDPKEKDISKAQANAASCMDACANEYAGKVPKLKSDLSSSLQKLGK
eukprot:GHUV01018495.1.p1 GENE.GHUV01018495.1~~GHUV01018495.1.p1  ORF type:complete len:142 (+),score=38.41 GHUV01018495.1:157-582(+)